MQSGRAVRVLLLALMLGAPAVGAADWYAELHVGTTRAEAEDPVIIGEERTEGAYGVGIGVEFNPYFSTQLDWHTLGENADVVAPVCPIPPCPITITTSPIPEHGWVLRALPRLPLGERFALELGIGAMRWEGDYSYTQVSTVVFEDSGTDPYYSFGAIWRFAEDWSVTIEAQMLQHDYYDFSWTGATLRWRF